MRLSLHEHRGRIDTEILKIDTWHWTANQKASFWRRLCTQPIGNRLAKTVTLSLARWPFFHFFFFVHFLYYCFFSIRFVSIFCLFWVWGIWKWIEICIFSRLNQFRFCASFPGGVRARGPSSAERQCWMSADPFPDYPVAGNRKVSCFRCCCWADWRWPAPAVRSSTTSSSAAAEVVAAAAADRKPEVSGAGRRPEATSCWGNRRRSFPAPFWQVAAPTTLPGGCGTTSWTRPTPLPVAVAPPRTAMTSVMTSAVGCHGNRGRTANSSTANNWPAILHSFHFKSVLIIQFQLFNLNSIHLNCYWFISIPFKINFNYHIQIIQPKFNSFITIYQFLSYLKPISIMKLIYYY